ncbi:hypothetical protein P8452_21818 [Trifolium repens]|nr:hypothetical protein P8452_21818 [Trifolium repens]
MITPNGNDLKSFSIAKLLTVFSPSSSFNSHHFPLSHHFKLRYHKFLTVFKLLYNWSSSSSSQSSRFLTIWVSTHICSIFFRGFSREAFRQKMKKELNSKKNQRTEPVTYLGRQVKSSAELVKMMKMKRENGIDAAHIITEVQGSILNQNMPSRNVGGTKASKSQLVGVQGTNTKPTKQCRNIGGTKATMAEGPNKSSLNMSSLNVAESKITTVEGPNKKPTKRISPSFSLASHSLEKKSKLSTSNESRTKVSNEANSHVMKKGVAAAANESQLEHQRNKQPMKSATSHNESLEKQQGPKKTPKMPG